MDNPFSKDPIEGSELLLRALLFIADLIWYLEEDYLKRRGVTKIWLFVSKLRRAEGGDEEDSEICGMIEVWQLATSGQS